MEFNPLDWCVFLGFIVFVVLFSLYKSRQETTSADYFLAGRKLTWWLIGISMIAANISTEHFVGMSGRGFELGLAIASYEWTAAVAIVLVAWFFLPRFLRAGIYTIPEYLEYRYSTMARGVMAAYMSVAYILVGLASVLYSGALGLHVVFGYPVVWGVWSIGLVAGIYTVYGGLKAVAWADLFCAIGLLIGGALLTVLGLQELGGLGGIPHGLQVFVQNAGDRLSTVKPWDHEEIPWVAVFLGGLWIPQLFYWGLNQFITQRALAARSLAEAQKGVLLTASLKLLIPFIIVVPGIIAYELYADEVAAADQAYPYLMRRILPAGLRGLMFAAIFGAVMSTLDSMLNSASTILTMDVYHRHLNREASQSQLIWVGRMLTALFVVVGCTWAPFVAQIGGGSVFKYIQTVWGFITPGIVVSFLCGLAEARTPARAAVGAMLLSPAIYGWCLWALPQVAFLHHQALTFIALAAYVAIVARTTQLGSPGPANSFRSNATGLSLLTGLLGTVLLARPLQAIVARSVGGEQFPELCAVLSGGMIGAYFGVVCVVMRAPAPGVKRADACDVPEPPSTGRQTVGKTLGIVTGATVLGLHLYLFATWVLPEHWLRWGWDQAPAAGSGATLLIAPLLLAVAGTAAMIWLWVSVQRMPAAARPTMPTIEEIDLTPSRLAPGWGAAVIAAVAALYCVFY
jgi:SSS family solute:Na+ symporter